MQLVSFVLVVNLTWCCRDTKTHYLSRINHTRMIMEFSANKLKMLRAERGWSQEQLSEIAGLSARTIQRMESEDSASPESLMAVASAFSISPSELQEEYKQKIGDGEFKPAGIFSFVLLVVAVVFYLNISGEVWAIIDIPAFLYIAIVPFTVSILSSGFGLTCKAYQLLLWLVYESKDQQKVHLCLPVLRKMILYSYAAGGTGTLFSLLGMLNEGDKVYYPAGFSIALLIFIYAVLQSEFLFRPLYHKLNRQLLQSEE